MAQHGLQFVIGNVASSPVAVSFSDFRSVDSFTMSLGGKDLPGNNVTINPGQVCFAHAVAQDDGNAMLYFHLGNTNSAFSIGGRQWNYSDITLPDDPFPPPGTPPQPVIWDQGSIGNGVMTFMVTVAGGATLRDSVVVLCTPEAISPGPGPGV
jgi:hypothetical protein